MTNPVIEFNEKNHTYIVNGIVTPSVTQLIHLMFPEKYKSISPAVLKRAAARGTKIHETIEYWNIHHELPDGYERRSFTALALNRWRGLEEKFKIHITDQEIPVCYMDGDMPLFAGKFDMLGQVNDIDSLLDIKATSKYDRVYLEIQLSMYRMAIRQTLGREVDKGYCVWLPKDHLGGLEEVKFRDEDSLLWEIRKLVNLTEEYHEHFDY